MEKGEAKSADANIYSSGEYLEKNVTWHIEDSPWKANQIHSMLSRNDITPKSICEVGCGAGEILRQLSEKYPASNLYGYELSPYAFELCKSRETERIKFKNRDFLAEDSFFDTLLCIDVFEHVEDYMGFIKAIRTKAKFKVFHIPLEISVLSVMLDSQIAARNDVGHLHYFTAATAIATLTDAGYVIVDRAFTTSFDGLPSKTAKAKIAKIPRKILYSIAPNFMVKLLGGCSLMVLAT